MSSARRAIRERDRVELLGGVGRWPAGTSGTVVSDYGDVKLIEVDDGQGATLDYITVAEPRLKLLTGNRI